MSLDGLHHAIAAVHIGLGDASAQLTSATRLLEQARRAMRDAQVAHAGGEPWLPAQLDAAIDELERQRGRLADAGDLLDAYQARL